MSIEALSQQLKIIKEAFGPHVSPLSPLILLSVGLAEQTGIILTQSSIAKELSVPKHVLSGALIPMYSPEVNPRGRLGLITYMTRPSDTREKLLFLTPKGHRLYSSLESPLW